MIVAFTVQFCRKLAVVHVISGNNFGFLGAAAKMPNKKRAFSDMTYFVCSYQKVYILIVLQPGQSVSAISFEHCGYGFRVVSESEKLIEWKNDIIFEYIRQRHRKFRFRRTLAAAVLYITTISQKELKPTRMARAY